MSRILSRRLPDGRRVEALELSPTLARVLLYTAASGRAYQSYDYPSIGAAVQAVAGWDGVGEPSRAVGS